MIAGPVFNEQLKHWSLLFISKIERKIYYIDPLGASTETFNAITAKVLSILVGKKYFDEVPFTKVELEHQKQNDAYNCGAFVCHFFDLLINNNFDGFKKKIDIDSYRYTIFNSIMTTNDMKICCVCRSAKQKRKLGGLFLTNLKKLKCSHVFHKDCLDGATCFLCNSMDAQASI
jgi:hypothetical protein